MSFARVLRRPFSTCTLIQVNGKPSSKFHQNFDLLPEVFTLSEQRILLAAALETLDSAESRLFRRRRNILKAKMDKKIPGQSLTLEGLFLPDECYQMEEACFKFFILWVIDVEQ